MAEQPPTGFDVASSSQEPGSRDKLFLGGLSWETNEDKVRRHFEKYGELQEVVVVRDRMTGKPRGFGFVTFQDKDAAERVCQEPQVLDGRQIDAKRSVPQEQKPRSKKIFVGGLAPDTDEDQFQEYFERYGKVTEAQIMQDHTSGRSRGFGFITFEDESSVEQCFAAGSMHQLGNKRVEVKTATPRGSGPMPRPAMPGFPSGARPLFPAGRPAFPGFPGQVAPGGGYPMQYPAGMSGFQSAAVMGAYGMGGPYAYNPYANMMMGGYGFHPYAYGPQYAGQAAAIAAAAAAQQQQQQQQQQAGGGYSPAAGQASGVNAAAAPSIQAAGPAPRVGTLPRSQAGVGPAQQPHTQQQTRLQQSGAGGRAGAPPSGLSPGMPGGPPAGDPPASRSPLQQPSQARQQPQQQSPQQQLIHQQQSPGRPGIRSMLGSHPSPHTPPPHPHFMQQPSPPQQQQQPQQLPQQQPTPQQQLQQQHLQQQFRQGQERMASFMLPSHSTSANSRPQPRGSPPS